MNFSCCLVWTGQESDLHGYNKERAPDQENICFFIARLRMWLSVPHKVSFGLCSESLYLHTKEVILLSAECQVG